MKDALLVQADIPIEIETDSPLLIKEPDQEVRRIAGELRKVTVPLSRRELGALAKTPFIPGASLRGVLRFQAERITRFLNPMAACDPFASSGNALSCADRVEIRWKHDTPVDEKKPYERVPSWRYDEVCPVCQLFGYAGWRGLARVGEARRTEGEGIRFQINIAVDRFSGGVATKGGRGPYNSDALNPGQHFTSMLRLENFALNHLALLGLTLRDLRDGLLTLGGRGASGYGQIHGRIGSIAVRYFGPKPPDGEMWGVRALRDCVSGEKIVEDKAPLPNMAWRKDSAAGGYCGQINPEEVFPNLMQAVVSWLKNYPIPAEMDPDRLLKLKREKEQTDA